MKAVTNDSLQGLEVLIRKPNGVETYWLEPKKTVVVEDYSITDQCQRLAKRLLVKIKSV